MYDHRCYLNHVRFGICTLDFCTFFRCFVNKFHYETSTFVLFCWFGLYVRLGIHMNEHWTGNTWIYHFYGIFRCSCTYLWDQCNWYMIQCFSPIGESMCVLKIYDYNNSIIFSMPLESSWFITWLLDEFVDSTPQVS